MVVEAGDTTKYMSIAFQNVKYQHITDIGVILLSNEEECDTFASQIKYVIPKAGGDEMVEFDEGKYKIVVGNNQNVFFYDSDGKYSFINTTNAIKLADWISTLEW